MTKFQSAADEYIWSGSVESGVVRGYGSSDGPLGWFADITLIEQGAPGWQAEESAAENHYGTRFLILHESNEGFVTVLPFDTEAKRNRRLTELQQALALHEAGVSEQQIVMAIGGYRRALEWHFGHDGQSLSWTDGSQLRTADEVTHFVTQNIEDLRIYMAVVDRGWEAIGGDFAFSRVGAGMGFTEFAGGDVATDLRAAAEAFGAVTVTVNEQNEMEVSA